MRIGGVFPFGEQCTAISLAAGATFTPPPGEYLIALGRVSVLQFWDNVNNLWRGLAGPGSTLPVSTDGTNYRVVNLSGVVQGCSFTPAGSAATNGIGTVATGVTVSFGTAPSSGRAAAAYPIVGGSINSTVTITQAGSGFLTPPHVFFDNPPIGGIKATAHCTLNSTGGIASIVVDNIGAGYVIAPNCYVQAQQGVYAGAPSGAAAAGPYPYPGLIGSTNGAVLTVNSTLTNSASLTGLVMTDYGVGYAGTTIPTVTLGGSISSAPTVTPIMSFSLTAATIVGGGTVYGAGVPPVFESSLGLVSATDLNNGVFLPRRASGTTTVAAGAVTVTTIEDPGFGIQKVPGISFMNTSVVPSTIATATAVVGGIQDTFILQPAVNG